MTDTEFKKLENRINRFTWLLEAMQKEHIKETGRRLVCPVDKFDMIARYRWRQEKAGNA